MHALFHDFFYRLGIVQLRLLLEEPDGIPGGEDGPAVELLVHPCEDAQQGALARAVEAQNPDLGPVEIGDGNVLEHGFLVIGLAHPDHGIDDLVRFCAHGAVNPPL